VPVVGGCNVTFEEKINWEISNISQSQQKFCQLQISFSPQKRQNLCVATYS